MAADEHRIDIEKGTAHVLREGEVFFPVAGIQIVVENAAGATRFVAVGQEKIFVAPFFEARIVVRVMSIAGGLVGGVKFDRVGMIVAPLPIEHRRQVAAAAEPALCRADLPRVHVDGGHARVVHMRDQRNAGGPEARVVLRAVHLLAELFRERAMHGRDMNADLLENAASHDRHFAAAFVFHAVAARPGRALEASGGLPGERACQFGFDFLEFGADQVAKLAKPGRGAGLSLLGLRVGGGSHGRFLILASLAWAPTYLPVPSRESRRFAARLPPAP